MWLIRNFRKIFLQFFIWSATILFIVVGCVWVGIAHLNQLPIFNQIISQNKLIFTTFRWSMILIIFYTWPHFIRQRARLRYWKPEKTIFWLNQRLKITFWLIIFELLICENLPLTLIHLLENH